MIKVRSLRRQNTTSPALTWVPVTDANGRVRMEMRWHIDTPSQRRTHRAA